MFWSVPKELRIDNFLPEKRDGAGNVIQRAQAIEFHGHLLITGDPKVIEYVKNSDSFKSNTCVQVSSLQEAQRKTAEHNSLMQVKTVESSAISKTDIDIAADGTETYDNSPYEEAKK